ncbi:hypothetical protein B0J13DRAFT_82682 [Dactylonectria estremocensis]|uniref:Zn(2)-C6 fungal-type domain-containing protein n=1 Tax=Dactylonectria estremocensis TaxID=1079267 RepID=A0A9P9EFH9_9HYPO|nr:hypothetical protein B0J13DRAFT_82682 [Dactylonectria estremocensis]
MFGSLASQALKVSLVDRYTTLMTEKYSQTHKLPGEEGASKQQVTRHTRTRNGCQRCRARRRKCDEVKPQCGRCADADVNCQYITRLSFLERNSQTLAQDIMPVMVGRTLERPTYSTVQFVGDPSSDFAMHAPARLESERPSPDVAGETRAINSSNASEDVIREREPRQSPSALRPSHVNRALESSNNPTISATTTSTLVTPGALREKHTIHLLKHYQTHVAPWLDVYDLGRTFGLLIPQLAMASPPVLDTLLQLAAIFSGSEPPEVSQKSGSSVLWQQAALLPTQVPSFTALYMIVVFVLSRLQIFIKDVPGTWENVFVGGGAKPRFSMYEFADKSHRRMWYGTVALMPRLELAYCLMHEVAPAWGSEVLREITAESLGSDDSQKIVNISFRCLSLLGDITGLCFGLPEQGDGVQTTPRPRLERWRTLLEELQVWYEDRPPELRSLAEFEDHQTIFPLILFTSAGAMCANVMFHTAMHILLSHKPRTARPLEQDESEPTNMSPLWHARRVCGIASTSHEQYAQCWDPCMIAAFFYAARRMTHQTQQEELLSCLESVKMAGWRVDTLSQRLRREWGT